MIALVPARAGSKRIPNKNTRLLAGQPLLVYSIWAAQASGLFDAIIVSTEDERTGRIAEDAGATWMWRPPALATGQMPAPDVCWVRYTLDRLREAGRRPESFALLRPTSPFRDAQTLQRAFGLFTLPDGTHDSLRAVEPVKQHPYKMWTWQGDGYPIRPLHVGSHPDGTPWHSSPTQSLPTIYVQNSSLEMAWTANVEAHGTIHGRKVMPFFTEGYEGFTLDYPEDWDRAEALIASGAAILPGPPPSPALAPAPSDSQSPPAPRNPQAANY